MPQHSAVGQSVSSNPFGKRDPMRSFVPDEPLGGGDGETQRFELGRYRLTGVLWGVEPRALLEDPDGVGHVVSLGSYVGRNWGKVTAIRSAGMVVTEEYLRWDGSLVVQPVELRLEG